MCLKNGFIISGTEKYENPIFIYVLISVPLKWDELNN